MTKELSPSRTISWLILAAAAAGCSSAVGDAPVDGGADDGGSPTDAAKTDSLATDTKTDSPPDTFVADDGIPIDTGTPSDTGTIGDAGSTDAGHSGLSKTTYDLWVATTGSDSNPGTKSAPFKTILHASTVVKPDTTVHVLSGTYDGGFRTNASGTATAPIHYVSEDLHGAKIVPPSTSSASAGWDNRGAYVTVYGFEIDGSVDPKSGTLWHVGLNLAGQGDVAMHNLVHHIFNNGVASGSGGAGILLDEWYGYNDMHALSNIVHHVGPKTGGSSWYHGIYQTATGSIEDNLSYANAGGGIHLWHDANHIDIFNNTSFGNGIGFIVGGGDFVHTTGPCDYVRVANNIAYDNTSIGFDEEGKVGTHNLFTHNLSFKNGTDWRLEVSAHTSDVAADPMFVKYVRTGGGDYHLATGSPAIDVGSSSYGPTIDLDDLIRPVGPAIDLGAYEWRP